MFGRPNGLGKTQHKICEIPIPSADETLINPEIPAVPSGVVPTSSIPIQTSLEASSSSGVKRSFSESTALPNLPRVTSGSVVKRACCDSTVLPIVSSGSGLKRAHKKSTANDDEEQPETRAQISNLIAGLHGVDAAEDDDIRTTLSFNNACPKKMLRKITKFVMVKRLEIFLTSAIVSDQMAGHSRSHKWS